MVDTNVVVDLLGVRGPWMEWSLERLLDARQAGTAAISAVVVGELATRFEALDDLLTAVRRVGLVIHDLGVVAAHRAGRAQDAYRSAGGKRERLPGDFLLGAHAETSGAPLITRDPRHYRTYFPDLTLITPETDA